MKIAYYISDHGFGHASRNIPVIEYILNNYSDAKLYIKTGQKQGQFIKDYILDKCKDNQNIQYYFDKMDIGLILKEGTLLVDQKRLEKEVISYVSSFDDKALKEEEFLKKEKIDMVVSDIVPWIFLSCKKLNIKSIFISNFTWAEQYKDYLDKNIYKKYEYCYSLCTRALFYDFYIKDMKNYIKNYKQISLCSREFNKRNIQDIRKNHKKPIIFISVGRSVNLDGDIDVSDLNYDFIVTEGIKFTGQNVWYLPINVQNTNDYVAASDYVISKAGFGTLSEVLLSKRKVALLKRDTVVEDKTTINILKNRGDCIEICSDELSDIKSIIKRLDSLTPNFERYKNDYKKIGDFIINSMN